MNTNHPLANELTFKNLAWVLSYLTCGKSTLYRMVQLGDFPKPVRLTKRHAAWRLSDIIAWAETRQAA